MRVCLSGPIMATSRRKSSIGLNAVREFPVLFGVSRQLLFPRCQTNSNSSLQGQYDCPLCRTETTPLSESGGAVKFEIRSS